MRLQAWLLPLVVIASMTGCDEKKEQVCEPFTIRADPYNPGAYRVCNRDGTDETKYQGPTPPPRMIPV